MRSVRSLRGRESRSRTSRRQDLRPPPRQHSGEDARVPASETLALLACCYNLVTSRILAQLSGAMVVIGYVRRTAALLLLPSLVLACHLPENPKRAAIRAITTFVLESAIDLQGRTVLTQSSARPALQSTRVRASATPANTAPKVRVCTRRVVAAPIPAFVARCRPMTASGSVSDSTARPFPTS